MAVASYAKPSALHHSVFTVRMLFLTPNQQCQNTEGINSALETGVYKTVHYVVVRMEISLSTQVGRTTVSCLVAGRYFVFL